MKIQLAQCDAADFSLQELQNSLITFYDIAKHVFADSHVELVVCSSELKPAGLLVLGLLLLLIAQSKVFK